MALTTRRALLDAVGDHARAQGMARGFVVASAQDLPATTLYQASGALPSDDEVVWAFSWDT
ncbi:MAG: hypothetical protein ACR2JF_11935 [Iamia sp.]